MDLRAYAIWWAILIVILSFNAYWYALRNVLMYWLGAIVFGAAGVQAASNHHGPLANVWGLVAFGGWLTSGIGMYGFPPRKPSRRIRRAP
ncbi:MAG: hypothetical protein QOF71_169 [Candidatus Eremiobacteraeota bacterium]|jgi:hypothetical protein|nr:hypothetical protein [Candidatus Eremiobacteraeota bacterium]